MRILPVLASFVFLLPAQTFAHGSGTPFDTVVGEYRFEIGASTVGVRPGEETAFQFELFRKNADGNLEYAAFDTMTVEISDGDAAVFAKDLPFIPGNVLRATYAFPDAGTYAMRVRYASAGTTIAEATVEIPVDESSGMLGRLITSIETGGVILVVIIAVGMTAWDRLRKPQP